MKEISCDIDVLLNWRTESYSRRTLTNFGYCHISGSLAIVIVEANIQGEYLTTMCALNNMLASVLIVKRPFVNEEANVETLFCIA